MRTQGGGQSALPVFENHLIDDLLEHLALFVLFCLLGVFAEDP